MGFAKTVVDVRAIGMYNACLLFSFLTVEKVWHAYLGGSVQRRTRARVSYSVAQFFLSILFFHFFSIFFLYICVAVFDVLVFFIFSLYWPLGETHKVTVLERSDCSASSAWTSPVSVTCFSYCKRWQRQTAFRSSLSSFLPCYDCVVLGVFRSFHICERR
mmetsp:Transcript_46873/g.120805  ORF Transcript_46873/g.120805 Transcript_46873/m.120805 type:complete len:160 (+) Transcript_46873:1412-1891(+)